MNINALIKFSSRYPQGEISQATFEYLSSMAHLEADHNARIAFLSERGARVASEPSQYWQRAFSALKFASMGFDVSEHFLYLDLCAHKAHSFEGNSEGLSKLSSENPALKRLVLGADVGAINRQDIDQDRKQKNKKQKGKGRAMDKRIDRFLRVENPNSREGLKKMESKLKIIKKKLLNPQDGSDFGLRLLKRVYALIGKDQAMKKRLKMFRAQWETEKKEPVQISYKTLKGNERNTSVKIENLTDNTRGKNKSKNNSLISAKLKAWEEAYGAHLDDVLALAKKAIQKQKATGQGAKKEEGAKSEGASETTTKSESGSDKPKTEAEKKKDFIEGAPTPEAKEERKELVQEKGLEDAQAMTFGGENGDEEETSETTPDGGETLKAVTEGVDLGSVKPTPKRPTQMALRIQRNLQQNMSGRREPKKRKKASEEGFSFSDFDSDTDFDIVF